MTTAAKPINADVSELRSRIRLLLVEADASERTRLRSGLEGRFAITEAADANEAVARLEDRHYDAILTAYEIGIPDGVWLLKHVSERHPHVHRTLMAAKFVPELADLLTRRVVARCEQKPLSAEHYSAFFAEPWESEDAEKQ
jgi:DNA-binding NtrC family response regulator